MSAPVPLLSDDDLPLLRTALQGWTVDAVDDLLGPVGRGAQSRGDLVGTARALRGAEGELATLTRLFLLGEPVAHRDARAALHPLPLEAASAAGLVEDSGAAVRASLDIRPYAEDAGEPWWVVSDLGSDVRPGPVAADHVLGVGAAALTLAQATPRDPVARALDVGTGCGVQALHLGRHSGAVTATDLSARALRCAATTAALSGQRWDLRTGWFTEPVDGERFDLVVANPPFVVSPGGAEHDYRDSGLAGDDVCRHLVRTLPGLLTDGGTAQLLANWIIPREGTWQDRVTGWLDDPATGPRCDAWVWQREVADPGEYVTLWLRDAGHAPGTAGWRQRYDAWLDWFEAAGVAGVGMGLVTLWSGGTDDPVRVLEDVPQAVEHPVGAEIGRWVGRRRRLHRTRDAELLHSALVPSPDLVRTRQDLLDDPDGGWRTRRATLRQSRGLRWELEVDDAVARVVAACAAGATPALALEVLAAGGAPAGSHDGPDAEELGRALAPVLRDLVGRGVLLFADDDGAGAPAGGAR